MKKIILFLFLFVGVYFAQQTEQINSVSITTGGSYDDILAAIATSSTYHEVLIFAVDSNASSTVIPTWFNQIIDDVPIFFSKATFGDLYYDLTLITNSGNAFKFAYPDTVTFSGGCDHVHSYRNVESVIDSADNVVDFKDYDYNNDDKVYIHFISNGPKSGGVVGCSWSFLTSDYGTSGYIRVYIKAQTRGLNQNLLKSVYFHEAGHDLFNFPDMDHSGLDYRSHYSLGGFEVMSSGGFEGVPSLYNPFFRDREGWFSPVPINSSMTNVELKDFQKNELCYIYEPTTLSSDAIYNQKFYVSYHKAESEYDNKFYHTWPFKDQIKSEGLIIWHSQGTSNYTSSYSDWRTMPIDIEAAHGKYDWSTYADSVHNTYVPNPLTGRDSMEIRKVVTIGYNDTEIQGPYYQKDHGSKSVFYTPDVSQDFTPFTNPNSNFTNKNVAESYAQNIVSGFSVKNLHTTSGKVYVDFTVNDFVVSENTTLAVGKWQIENNITVASNVTLTIQAGTELVFKNGAQLKVNGTLNVNGTSSNKVTFDFESPTYPNGIWFWLGGTGIINNAIIKNAYYGVRAYQSVATIKNSEIKNCTQGIQMDYLRGNTTGNMYVLNNSIHDIGYTGIYFNSSTGKVRDNEVYNCNVGTACSNYSSPDFGEVGYYGNNNFHNNRYYGFYASSNSNPFFGLSSCTTQGGENSFVDNTVYNGFAKYTCYVLAQGNWWGSNPPDESKIVTEYVSTIDFSFYLENPPGTLSANKVPTPEEIVYDTQFKSVVETAPVLSISSDSKSGFNSTWPILWKLRYARNLIGVEDYPFARKICKTIIDENPDSALATYALDLLWRASTNDKKSLSNFEDYLSKKVLSKKANVLFGDMSLILNTQDKTNSKNSNFDKIIDKYKGTRVEESAIFNKLVFSLNENNNREEAVNLLNVLQTNFPNSETIRLAQLELGLVVDEHLAPQLVKNASNEETTEIPKTYELLGNYPNPFNPSTTISYALPYSSNVELTIYDITGKVVKVFNENGQSAGYQNIVWFGNN
ncbi:MAG: T9SS type A sorting domain-containing protein, partial [Bacteroidetes bacterium]|nr:T9SS type A sorting domain-containing protein [Bacteroidota bacterium]